MSQREAPAEPFDRRNNIVRAEIERVARAAVRSSNLSGTIVSGDWGYVVKAYDEPWFLARVTAADASSPIKYSWTQVIPDGAGGWSSTPECVSGTPAYLPAFSANGIVYNTFPFYVHMFRGWDNFVFFYDNQSGSDQVSNFNNVTWTFTNSALNYNTSSVNNYNSTAVENYYSGNTLNYSGVSWNITDNTTTTISNTKIWTVTGYQFNVNVTNVNVSNSSVWNYDSTTNITYGGNTVIYAGPTVNLTLDQNWTISNTKNWIIKGPGTLKFDNTLIVNYAGPVVNLTDNQTWTTTGGKTWTVTGGTLVFNTPTVNVGNGSTWTYDSTTSAVYNGILDLCGWWYLCQNTETAFTGTTDDWVPANSRPAKRLSSTIDVFLGGMVPHDATQSEIRILENVGSHNITLSHQVGSSAANNRFNLSTGNPGLVLKPNYRALFRYDATENRWHDIGVSAAAAPGQGVSVEVSGGGEVGPEAVLNFIPGTNITSITATDNPPDIDITINAAGGSTGTNGQSFMGSDYITTSSWADTGTGTLSLPGAGTYLLTLRAWAQVNTTSVGDRIFARLYDATGAGAVPNSTISVVVNDVVNVNCYGGGSAAVLYTVAGATTIQLQAERSAAGTVNSAVVLWASNGTGGNVGMTYVQLS